jgi:hypothetical protein
MLPQRRVAGLSRGPDDTSHHLPMPLEAAIQELPGMLEEHNRSKASTSRSKVSAGVFTLAEELLTNRGEWIPSAYEHQVLHDSLDIFMMPSSAWSAATWQ